MDAQTTDPTITQSDPGKDEELPQNEPLQETQEGQTLSTRLLEEFKTTDTTPSPSEIMRRHDPVTNKLPEQFKNRDVQDKSRSRETSETIVSLTAQKNRK